MYLNPIPLFRNSYAPASIETKRKTHTTEDMSESEIQQLITANQSCSNDESQPGEVDTSYCFKWNNYQNHLSEVVRQLLDEESMVDVTLWAGGERIHAHRLVLCACSTLFQVIITYTVDDKMQNALTC